MIAEDLIDYYLNNFNSSLDATGNAAVDIPILQSWDCVDINNQTKVHGHLFQHHTLPPGKYLESSAVQRYFVYQGHVCVATKNSTYRLGIPLLF
ncbi:hypothetical protein AM1_0228 [Acaryochloris marina MBIC11017]|uniref:Uncharacterized protein n=1 Tax=Acaryochloris marina (strain MBIC 11017) TaxID=329726 RepID=B0C7Q4_ACAM1|nr:hypothetical protein AM1_0228 [Acaryochloris marina MBIC11017]